VAGAMGLMLLRRACTAYDSVYNIGGNENSRRIFPRLADRTIADAGANLVLPMRFGAVFHGLGRGIGYRISRYAGFLGQVPLRHISKGIDSNIKIEAGISDQLKPLFDVDSANFWAPAYDFEYVSWQLGRCPAIATWSCYLRSAHPLNRGIVIWRPLSGGFWRMVLFGAGDRRDEAKALLRSAIAFIHQQHGMAISVIASRLDIALIDLLKKQGFFRRYFRLPLDIMRGRDTKSPLDEFASLGFVDSDLAYRFSAQ